MEYFKEIGKIKYEGPDTDNPLAFRWYDGSKIIAGKTMKEHLRFACSYWHSFNGNGAEPFGEPTHIFPWNSKADPLERAKEKVDVAFEFIHKTGLLYYCFHDMDVVDFTNNIPENEKRLKAITDYLAIKQRETGIRLLWGTANLFSNRKFANGAATNPDFTVLMCSRPFFKTGLSTRIY